MIICWVTKWMLSNRTNSDDYLASSIWHHIRLCLPSDSRWVQWTLVTLANGNVSSCLCQIRYDLTNHKCLVVSTKHCHANGTVIRSIFNSKSEQLLDLLVKNFYDICTDSIIITKTLKRNGTKQTKTPPKYSFRKLTFRLTNGKQGNTQANPLTNKQIICGCSLLFTSILKYKGEKLQFMDWRVPENTVHDLKSN